MIFLSTGKLFSGLLMMEGKQIYCISEGCSTRTEHEKKALHFRIIRFMFEAGIKAICYWASVVCNYTVSEKKGATLFLPVTLRNVNRFSKLFYHHTLQ